MFRNIGFGAAAVLAVGALAIGCSDDGDTIIGGGILTTDNFPGSAIQDANVADDGRAFTAQGQDVFDDDLEIYFNVTNGNAIAVYETETTNNDDTILWAAPYINNQWKAPVELRGRDLGAATPVFHDPDDRTDGWKVLWLNTAGNADPAVAARNGDAIILFSRNDLPAAPGQTSTEEDVNERLWMTYFDVSAVDSPAANGVVRGITTDAITVDDEVFFTSATDPSVSTFGFVSDSHEGTHAYTSGVDSVDSGQPTTFASIVYLKQDVTTNGARYLTKAIVGDAVDNDLAGLLGAEEEIVAGVALVTSESANSTFFTHNELMVWNATKDPGFDVDTSMTATTFDGDGPVDSVAIGNAAPAINDESDEVDLEALYGPDHDLAAFYIVYTESGFRPDNGPSTGDRDSDTDLFVAQINADDTLAVESVKIENFADTLELTTQPLRSGANTGVFNVDTRLNRSADFITILFQEVNTDVTTLVGGNTPNVNTLLYVTAVQTRRASTFGDTVVRTLADSVFDSGTAGGDATPLQAPAFVSTGDTTVPASDEADVDDVDFQRDLVIDFAATQADDGESPNPGCAIQSNAFRVNFIYTQLQDTTGTNSDLEDLLVNGITFTPGVLVDDSPDVDLVDAREVVDTRDVEYTDGNGNFFPFDAVALDAGDQTRDPVDNSPTDESGRVLVFYTLNGNNPQSGPLDTATAFLENRLFVYDQGDNSLVSTDGLREFDQLDEILGAETVPANEDFRNTPHYAGNTLHIFWGESVDNGGEGRIVTRSYDKNALNDGATTNDTLDTRFTPNLVAVATGDDPVQIDQVTNGPLTVSFTDEFVTARSGSTVGVYFSEDEHIYYTDSSSDALGWDYENGLPAPQIVDNDSLTGLRVLGWSAYLAPECDDLNRSMVVFARDDESQFNSTSSQAIRAYVRVHN